MEMEEKNSGYQEVEEGLKTKRQHEEILSDGNFLVCGGVCNSAFVTERVSFTVCNVTQVN